MFVKCILPLFVSYHLELVDYIRLFEPKGEDVLDKCVLKAFEIFAEITSFRVLRDIFYRDLTIDDHLKHKILNKYPLLKARPRIPSLYIAYDENVTFIPVVSGELQESELTSHQIYTQYMKEFCNLVHFTCPLESEKSVERHLVAIVTQNSDFLKTLLNTHIRYEVFFCCLELMLKARCQLPVNFDIFMAGALFKNNLLM
ncbi:hypothetical protein RF11_07529 [Thelohanellus kitauei]|uniref:Uncharacterized protein n=1 Tax=Thelohanellus kitauei TaxID=669202 RepID=A0A0C2J543_THEKT|nr:hypothetical protein RF11_07529 [Thelohanellus kitauei]